LTKTLTPATLRTIYAEANISTKEAPPRPSPRIPSSQPVRDRPKCYSPSPSKGPKTR